MLTATTTTDSLVEHLRSDIGIREDDLVFLFSGVWGLGKLGSGIETIEQAFDKVLPKGVLIVPTFSYSWDLGEHFDSATPCPEMGSFSNFVLSHSDYYRTDNPNFSVAIKRNGWNQALVDDLLDVGNDCFDDNSIFGKVVNYSTQRRAWIVLLGGAFSDVKYRSTFIHYAQQKIGVDHRYIKRFYSPDGDGRSITQSVRFFSEEEYVSQRGVKSERFCFPVEEDYNQYGLDVDGAGLLISKQFALYYTKAVPVLDSVNLFIEKARNNPLYCIAEDSIR